MKRILMIGLTLISFSLACQDEIVASGVAVKGYATITRKPELAIAYFSITGTGKNETKAIQEADRKYKEFSDSLKIKKLNEFSNDKIGIIDGSGNGRQYFSSNESEQVTKSIIVRITAQNTDKTTQIINEISSDLGLANVTGGRFESVKNNGYIYTSKFPTDIRDSLYKIASIKAKNNAETIAKVFNKEIGDLILIYEACTNSGEYSCSFPNNDYMSRESFIDEKFYSQDKDKIEFKAMTEVRYEFKK